MQNNHASIGIDQAPRPFARLTASPVVADASQLEGDGRFVTFRTMYSTPVPVDGDEYDG